MPPAAEPGGTRRPFSASAEGSAASPALIQAHTPVPRNPFVFPAENMAASAMVFNVQKIGIPLPPRARAPPAPRPSAASRRSPPNPPPAQE